MLLVLAQSLILPLFLHSMMQKSNAEKPSILIELRWSNLLLLPAPKRSSRNQYRQKPNTNNQDTTNEHRPRRVKRMGLQNKKFRSRIRVTDHKINLINSILQSRGDKIRVRKCRLHYLLGCTWILIEAAPEKWTGMRIHCTLFSLPENKKSVQLKAT